MKSAIFSMILILALLSLQGQKPRYGTLTDIEGHIYRTVVIGDYEWMAENLKVGTYNNGTEIPLVSEHEEWAALKTGAYCWYDNDQSNSQIYGALYNWYAVDTQMLCPDGWRIPSDLEWNKLEAEVDSRYVEGDLEWYRPAILRGYDAAERLKSDSGWRSDGDGRDSYGFQALPGGERRVSDGGFFQKGGGGFWWSSTEDGSSGAWFRNMAYSFKQAARNTHDKGFGFSVRCIRDLEK